MITTSNLLLRLYKGQEATHLPMALRWTAPSGWEDVPPPPDVALVMTLGGLVAGRAAPPTPKGPQGEVLAPQRIVLPQRDDEPATEVMALVGRVFAMVFATAQCGRVPMIGGGTSRSWPVIVVPGPGFLPLTVTRPLVLRDLSRLPGFLPE